jgi:cellulose synthase/poly-beta-1,6-N-acetylglucosamine synthase-like glycosyltransferase
MTRAAVSGLVLVVAVAASAASLRPASATSGPPGANAPELPRAYVDTTLVPPSGATVLVPSGASLQAALDAAQPGDVIVLEPGATFTGPFTLPAKSRNEWITVRPAVSDDRLPPPGTRIDPSYAAVMPKLESGSGPAVAAAPGAHHYRFIGIEIRPKAGAFLTNLVALGLTETAVAELPHHIIFDRCYLHGDPSKGARRGIAMNSGATAVIDSHLSDFKEVGADSQAIAGWNGLGPFKIVNNYLEGAGENVMFGGADPSIVDLVPSDIEIRHNHFAKPLAWKAGEPGYQGTAWSVKNLFELKNARRVLVDGNTFENIWAQAQAGFAMQFTVRNQDGGAPWSAVEDVTFSNNTVRHAAAGINILGRDERPSQRTKRITIRNNLFEDVDGERWGGSGTLLQVLRGGASVVFDHNTAFHTGNILGAEGEPNEGFVYRNNISPYNAYGMIGTGTAPGNNTLAAYFPGATVARNVMFGNAPDAAELYPPDNFFPPTVNDVGFVNRAGGDYHLAESSPYKSAGTDGKDLGVIFSDLMAAAAPIVPPPLGHLRTNGSRPPQDPRPALPPVPEGSTAKAVFWTCALLLAYTYLGYPLLIWAWSSVRRRPLGRRDHEPTVTVVVVAQNEAARIHERIENLLSLDYPPGHLEVLLASDGSSDGTDEQARSYEGRDLRVFAFGMRRGKPAVLNELVPQAHGDIVVLADARQRFARGALRALVAAFADTSVGAVSGELFLTEDGGGTTVEEGVGFYWRYEKSVRRNESRLDSTVGATGAIYAIRRELFEPIPEDTLLDDVLIPMKIARRGYRAVFEPAAQAHDRAAASAAEEFSRKVRTIAGNFQLFFRNPWLLDPRHNRLWFQTFSHKVLRLLTPVLLGVTLVANLLLRGSAFYVWTLVGQATFYAAAVSGGAFRNRRGKVTLLGTPYLICLLSWATVVAFLRFVTGRQPVTWERQHPDRRRDVQPASPAFLGTGDTSRGLRPAPRIWWR